jgi:NDP-sugar pyrophosphorylase family protein
MPYPPEAMSGNGGVGAVLNIVVPMAGRGSRFVGSEQMPKPLIEVVPGRRMIDYVIDYLTIPEPHRFIFVVQEEHAQRFGLGAVFAQRTRDHRMVTTRAITRGPADSVLLAAAHIDNGDDLLVAYCDMFLDIDVGAYLGRCRASRADGALLLYQSDGTMESYAVADAAGRVSRTAEKERICDEATAGLYYFREGRRFVAASRRLVERSEADGREVFVCPVYNELIADGGMVLSERISRDVRFEMGTPEDLRSARGRLARATA